MKIDRKKKKEKKMLSNNFLTFPIGILKNQKWSSDI